MGIPVAESLTFGVTVDKVFVPRDGAAVARYRVKVCPVEPGRYDASRREIQSNEPLILRWADSDEEAMSIVAAGLNDIRSALQAIEVARMVEGADDE